MASRHGFKFPYAVEFAFVRAILFEFFPVNDLDGAIGAKRVFCQPDLAIAALADTPHHFVIRYLWRRIGAKIARGDHDSAILGATASHKIFSSRVFLHL